MESRFAKYKNEGKTIASKIANINSFVDYLYSTGNDTIENEIQDLQRKIDNGNAPAIFSNKVDLLIKLGECIERVHETYHFNR